MRLRFVAFLERALELARTQFVTWIAHAGVTLFVPAIVARLLTLPDRLATAAFASTAVLVFYVLREIKDRGAGFSGHHHKDEPGITGEIDMWGDLLGPVSVTATYWVAWWLALSS